MTCNSKSHSEAALALLTTCDTTSKRNVIVRRNHHRGRKVLKAVVEVHVQTFKFNKTARLDCPVLDTIGSQGRSGHVMSCQFRCLSAPAGSRKTISTDIGVPPLPLPPFPAPALRPSLSLGIGPVERRWERHTKLPPRSMWGLYRCAPDSES